MRTPWAILASGAASLALAGCRRTEDTRADERTQLRVWSMWAGDEEKVFQSVVDHYNRVQNKVYIHNLGAVEDTKIIRSIVAGSPPDFFTLREPGYLAPLAANNALLPLDDWFRESGLREDDFIPAALAQGRYQGKLYSMPYLLDAQALFYNPDHFRRAGIPPNQPPRTLEAMLDYARRLTVKSRTGAIQTLGMRPPDLIYIIGAFGGQFIDPRTGAPTADHPTNIEAARYYRALIEAMGDGKEVQAFTMSFGNEQGTNNPFFLGKISIMINGQWNPAWFQKYAPHVPYEVAPVPHPARRPDLRLPTWIGQNMFCIPRESKHPREAWAFFLWMQTQEAQLLFAETMRGIPNIRRVLKHPQLRTARNPNEVWKRGYSKFLDLVDSPNARFFPITPVATLYLHELYTAQDYLISGNKTPEAALRDVQGRVAAEFRRQQA
ncbi:MAG: ABC transporter substrate-binding protein [Fimbriimonadales bacterium]|nr:ABC transporter substrate-binding protein [Fimbriimonadales bacterium]